MLRLVCTFLFLVFIHQNIQAQAECNCCTQSHFQFDFWLGEWNVYDTDGKKIGENHIVKLEAGCLVRENWKGKSGVTGSSYNFFDPADSSWNQIWVDNQGNNLKLKGKASSNSMVLQSEISQSPDGTWQINRITWTVGSDGNIIQLWEVLDKNQEVKSIAFKGIYKKKSAD
ncbi:hypothetical protein [Echinicola salinicaeni]|uniref:hypothetical protein n=1 Tax=Echinicola salinicaeni TaxID=2762757 RepID=UPI0016480FAD|nr:hypothetical protein [Echinicola salinicaeni]